MFQAKEMFSSVHVFKMYCLYFVARIFYVKKQIILNPLFSPSLFCHLNKWLHVNYIITCYIFYVTLYKSYTKLPKYFFTEINGHFQDM